MDQNRSCKSSEMRVGHSLSEAEKKYLVNRIKTILQCLEKNGIPCTEVDMPNIAVLGSGGGLRVMVGLLGSLSQLKEEGLLDCIMYLSGVSGSTWCMSSLYKEPDWSANLDTVKKTVIQRLVEGSVSWSDMNEKLVNYYKEKDNFSLTDVWAVLIVSNMVKEIDEHKLTEQRGKYTNDPYPIYTVIDKQCKHKQLKADVWFEITPDESGYSLTGAFVDSSCWGSQFENGEKKKHQPEIDMLFLQGLCGSALADMTENLKAIYNALINLIGWKKSTEDFLTLQIREVKEGYELLLNLSELNLAMLEEKDPTDYLKTMEDLLKGKQEAQEAERMTVHLEKEMETKGTISETELNEYTVCVCDSFTDSNGMQSFWDEFRVFLTTIKNIALWKWGTHYNYLYKMKVMDIHPSVLDSKTRDYIDAGLLINSPYFSVLRQERKIDLIISLDYSAGDPFETVVKTAQVCKDLQIPFPEVAIPHPVTEPQDFYVFWGCGDAPTVIHMPLFNVINCPGEVEKWKETYSTSKRKYTHLDITDLQGKATENITNNKEKLITVIKNVIEKKKEKNLGKI